MFKSLEIFPEKIIDINEGWWKRSCRLVFTGDQIEKQETLWWEYPNSIPYLDSDDCDSYLLATFLIAMKEKVNLHIHGRVSSLLLANIAELQKVWSKWCPNLYKEIEVTVEQIDHEVKKSSNVGLAAYSGGADAQFTMYRHTKHLAGYKNQNIRYGILVHGFDIPLVDTVGFQGAAKKAQKALSDLNVTFIYVRTNIREMSEVNWEHYCGSALASVLNGAKKIADYGLIASGESYDNLVEPWGSHPMTNPMLSSADFIIYDDGAGFSRSEKIKIISEWTEGVKQLRVCWSGGKHDRNCGVCEKCVRTRLNFLLAGLDNPQCFDTPFDSTLFRSIALSSEAARAEWLMVKYEMIKLGVNPNLIKEVDKVIKRPAIKFSKILPVGSARREWVKKILGKNK